MNLVDEKHVAVLQVGEDGGQIAGPLHDRSRGGLDVDLHLVGDDVRQGGLAEAGRPAEQDVVDGVGALAGGLDEDAEVFLALRLPDVVLQRQRPQADFEEVFLDVLGSVHDALDHSAPLCYVASFCSVSLRSVSSTGRPSCSRRAACTARCASLRL